jgi:AcrR family transcriptional regulator
MGIVMGHREQLLEGAKKCLLEKGFARTTARDIVAASNTNLGSIGYHFGTKDALMNAALIQATEEWGNEIGQTLAENLDPDATPIERFETTWTRVISLFEEHRALWVAQFEVFTHLQHSPEMRLYAPPAAASAARSVFPFAVTGSSVSTLTSRGIM